MEILAVHASFLCAFTNAPTVSQTDLTVFKYVAKTNLIVVVGFKVVAKIRPSTHMTTVSQTDLIVLIWLSLSRI